MADIKVFISSVQKEFASERRLLCDYIRTDSLLGRFFVPFIFEDMPASEVSAQKAYLTQAAECHIYLGILGTQYGYEDEEGISPTEREYDTATAHHAHRLIYTLRTDTPRNPKEQAFIGKVEQEVVRRGFATYDELRTAVYNSLVDYLVRKEIIRRVPFDAAAHPVATYDDIDPEKVRTFVNRAKEKRNFPLNFEDGIEKIFSAIHVLTDDGRLTNSALLLFAKDPQRFFRTSEVRCAQFYGTKVEKPIRNYQVFTGSLFEISPAQAIAILELFQQKDATDEVTQEIQNDLTPEDKAAQEKSRQKRPPLDFYVLGLKEGDVLIYKHDENITCSVHDNKHVFYNGATYALSPLTAQLLGGAAKYVQPTPHWVVAETGRLLLDVYDEKIPFEENE